RHSGRVRDLDHRLKRRRHRRASKVRRRRTPRRPPNRSHLHLRRIRLQRGRRVRSRIAHRESRPAMHDARTIIAGVARLTFQDLILRLQNFWAERGCMIYWPLDLEVGAGTMHPSTFLRVLGPEPWSVAYVQPSRRPADGRYGDNPFRLSKHYQFQVVLKPSPIDVQDLYLDSLRAMGLDLTRHDIRFEEDNWESPTLGAWGVGWQVLLDGMEITQFTYFQQAGGIDLSPISAEITYGLE